MVVAELADELLATDLPSEGTIIMKTSRLGKHWTKLLAMATAVLAMAGSHAYAGLTTTIDGITVPIGGVISVSGIEEQLVTGPSQTLLGVGEITSIAACNVCAPTYIEGQNGLFLTLRFQFTSSFALAPTLLDPGYVEFSSGSAEVYVNNSLPSLQQGAVTTANQVTDYNNASAGTLFLGLTPQTFATNAQVVSAGGPSTTVLEAIISNNNTLASFSSATGNTFLDATSGDAMKAFHTCAQSPAGTGTCPPGTADLTFGEQFSTTVAGDFPVSGSATVKGLVQAVPEPASLGLLGGALMAFAAISRRRRTKA